MDDSLMDKRRLILAESFRSEAAAIVKFQDLI